MLQKEFGKGFIFGECSPNIDLQKRGKKSGKKKVFLALFLMELCKDGRRRIFDLFCKNKKKSKRRCLQNITQSENHQYRWLNGQEKVRKKKADVHLPDLQKNWGLVFSFRDKKNSGKLQNTPTTCT